MPVARPKKESSSATPPSDDGRPKESHAENSKIKRKYVYNAPIFLRAPKSTFSLSSYPAFSPPLYLAFSCYFDYLTV